jgi:hypothetical protein
MLIRNFVRARKTILAAAATTLLAGAFQTGGCTVNVDQATLDSLTGLLQNVDNLQLGPGGLRVHNHGTGDTTQGGDGGETNTGETGGDQPT